MAHKAAASPRQVALLRHAAAQSRDTGRFAVTSCVAGTHRRGYVRTTINIRIIRRIIITDLYSAFRYEDTEVLDAAQED